MSSFKKRRHRIRASDKSLVLRSLVGNVALLFSATMLLLNIKTVFQTDWKSVTLLQNGSVYLTITDFDSP